MKHEDIDHTGLTGAGGSVATDAIWDAAGDLAVGSGANTAAKLSIGASNGMILQRLAGAVAWGYPPFRGAKVMNTGTQTIATGVEAAITFDEEEYDTDAFHDTGSNTSRLTAPVTGYYHVDAILYFVSGLGNATLPSAMSFYVNGTAVRAGSMGQVTSAVGAGGANQLHIGADIYMTAAQYVEIKFYNGTSGNVVLGHASAAAAENAMSIHLIGV